MHCSHTLEKSPNKYECDAQLTVYVAKHAVFRLARDVNSAEPVDAFHMNTFLKHYSIT